MEFGQFRNTERNRTAAAAAKPSTSGRPKTINRADPAFVIEMSLLPFNIAA